MGGLWTIQRGALQGLLIKTILARGGDIAPNKKFSKIIEHHDGGQGAIEAIFADSSSYRGDLWVEQMEPGQPYASIYAPNQRRLLKTL